MTIATTTDPAALPLWTEEPASRPDRARIRARIGGLHCSLCTSTIEKALGRKPGVDKVAVSLTHEQALVEYDPAVADPDELLQTLRDIGYTLHDPRKLRLFEEEERDLVREGRRFLVAVTFSLIAIALIATPTGIGSTALPLVAALGLIGFVFLVLRAQGLWIAASSATGLGVLAGALLLYRETLGLIPPTPWLVGALASVLVFGVARHILSMAIQALRHGILNQHVLLEAGAFAGLTGGLIGLIFDPPGYPTAPFFAVSVIVATYHLFSEWLSLIVKTRSSQAVKRLLDLQPDVARVVRNGREVEIPIADVVVGDVVRIRPGERLPVDGEVVEGHSSVNQALVTGEPIPGERSVGDIVIGGSINGTGTLLVRVTAVGEESFLQRVAREVEDARALKPGLLHLVNRVLVVYTPTVLSVAAIAVLGWAIVPWLLGSEPDLPRAVFAGLSVLVMGYPCAVGISAPLSIVRGAGEAAERGILMRTGEAFQGYRLINQIVLDKTGTVTEGRPRLIEIEAMGVSDEELLGVAAAAEASSEHPLADAIVTAAFERGITPPDAELFEAIPGKGVRTRIGGQVVLVGSPRFLIENDIALGPPFERIAALETAGRTVIAVARDGQSLGVLALGDAVRSEAAQAVAALKDAGLGTVLVTGDNELTARRIAAEVGIDEVHAGVLPGEKAELVRRLQASGRVAMVGDGINDAPALMQADVGIAMGGGTDIAIDAADIIILGNRLDGVVTAREISRHSYRKMLQNVSLAFLFNGIGVPLAATGLFYPVWAMVAMAVSVTTIFFNSLWGQPSLFFQAILSVGKPVPLELKKSVTVRAASPSEGMTTPVALAGSLERGGRNAFRNRTRAVSVVLLLALVVGALAVMTQAAILSRQQIAMLEARVRTLIELREAGAFGTGGFGGDKPIGEEGCSTETLAAVMRIPHAAHIARVDEYVYAPRIDPSRPNAYAMVIGLHPGAALRAIGEVDYENARIIAGRSFQSEDAGKRVTIVGRLYARQRLNLDPGPDGALAERTVPLNGAAFHVIGIYATGNDFGDNHVFVPMEPFRAVLRPGNKLSKIFVTVDSVANVERVVADLKRLPEADVVTTPEAVSTARMTLGGLATASIYAIALLLMIGIVLVVFVMVLSLRERVSEIGTLKAIGASDCEIVGQLISEAGTLCGLGGIGAVIVAVAGTGFLRAILELSVSLDARLLLAIAGGAALFAIVGSLYPVIRVRGLSPVEAMRSTE